VVRFGNGNVVSDVESLAIAIAGERVSRSKHLDEWTMEAASLRTLTGFHVQSESPPSPNLSPEDGGEG
jgi:hypothetical protein